MKRALSKNRCSKLNTSSKLSRTICGGVLFLSNFFRRIILKNCDGCIKLWHIFDEKQFIKIFKARCETCNFFGIVTEIFTGSIKNMYWSNFWHTHFRQKDFGWMWNGVFWQKLWWIRHNFDRISPKSKFYWIVNKLSPWIKYAKILVFMQTKFCLVLQFINLQMQNFFKILVKIRSQNPIIV